MKSILAITIAFFCAFQMDAQTFQYEVSLEPLNIPELGGLHSYAIATHGDEWLIVGGRLDGLHQRQPFASFTSAGNNNQIIVVNPATGTVWKQDIDFLPSNLKEQLSSTNMQFYQDDGMLIVTGGYAYSPTHDDHITFPYLTVLDVAEMITKVKEKSIVADDFSQIEDDFFAVTGGRLDKMDDTYYLVGGQKFMGRYNPMGPDFGPGFFQEYTDAIRKFKLDFEPELTLKLPSAIIDSTHLHRRDYNLVPQIVDQSRILMLYSGVFQKNENLPWLYPIAIDQDTFSAISSFQQKFNHYHCATLPIYDPASLEMHTLFFGGIAQFYEEDGVMVQDNDVPFVNTIADVAILSDGTMVENINKTSLPGYLGAGSEFIFAPDVAFSDNGILDGSAISHDQVVGYIYGGIRSNLPNIFFINTGVESEASPVIYKVKLSRQETSSNIEIGNDDDFKLQVYPNPVQNFSRVLLTLAKPKSIDINVYDLKGQMIHQQRIAKSELNAGQNYLILDKFNVDYGAYIYTFKIGKQIITRKVIWSE